MKRLFALIVLSPFLVCDPQAGVMTYQIAGLGAVGISVPAEPDGSIRYDLVDVKPGTYKIEVKACADPWGCSDPSPFGFTRPGLNTPANVRLGK